MAQEAALEWMRQFECEEDAQCTHTIDEDLYNIPTRQLASFHDNAQRLINLGRKSVRERVPETTPAFFVILAPVTNSVTSSDAVEILAQLSLGIILGGDHQTDAGSAAAAVLTKVCVVLRSPSFTNAAGDEVESMFFLFPRLLVKHDSMVHIRKRIVDDFIVIKRSVPDVVDWDIRNAMQDKTPAAVLLYGSTPKDGLSRSFYRAYDEMGKNLSLEEVFEQKERALPACYMYSLNRLSRRIERAKELSPEMKQIEELLRMIGSHRLNVPSDVVAISQAVYAASKGSMEGSLVLEEFLGSAEQTREMWCEVAIKEPQYTTMTLRYMASVDNPLMFKNMLKNEVKAPLWRSTGPYGSDLDIANILKAMYSHLFAYDKRTSIWYYYDGSHWVDEEDHAATLREKMRTEIIQLYEDLIQQISRIITQTEGESKGYKERVKNCGKIIQRLGKKSDKTAIIGEASDLFTITKLDEKLDGVLSFQTFAYADCVYNLVPEEPNKSAYSAGRPEDFCKRHSPLRVSDNRYTMEHPEVKTLLAYLRQVLASYNENDEPNEEVMWYTIDRQAVCLEGGNRLKYVTIWEGPLANNSKSTFESIIHDGMGGYSATIATAKVIGKKRGDADGPTPMLRHAQGARNLWIKETTRHERINAGQLLELSSGLDPIPLRDPHSKVIIEVIPSYKITLVVNNAPRVDPEETGVFVRVKNIQWLSQFLSSDQVPEDEYEQRQQRKYPLNPQFSRKRAALIAPMMWLLGERYKMVGKYGPKEPAVIAENMERYKLANDVFLRYIREATQDGEGGVAIDDLYAEFKGWFKNRYPQTSWYSQDDLYEWMTKHRGKPKWGTTWEGMRLLPKIQRVVALA